MPVQRQVGQTKCRSVGEKQCQDFPVNVPRKECREFPRKVCTQEPVTVPRSVSKRTCYEEPRQSCIFIPRQEVWEVPRTVNKKVCHSTKPSTPVTSGSSQAFPDPIYYPQPDSGAQGSDYVRKKRKENTTETEI